MAEPNVVPFGRASRLPVSNPRWRGRFPPNVINRRARTHWVYLEPGDEATVRDEFEEGGRRVRLLRVASPEDRKRLSLEGRVDRWFLAELIGWTAASAGGRQINRAFFHASELKRGSSAR